MDTRFIQFSGSMQPMPSMPVKDNKGLIVKIIIITAVAVSIIIVGLLATGIWDPHWNPFKPNPDKVIKEIMGNMVDLDTLHYVAKIGLVDTEANATVSIVLTGDYDNRDLDNPKNSVSFNLAITEEGSNNIAIKGESRNIGDVAYIRFDKIEVDGLESGLAMVGTTSDKFKKQWIRFDENSSDSLFGESEPEDFELSEQQKQEIKDLFEQSEIFYTQEIFKNEEINGKKAYHYLTILNNNGLVDIIVDILEIVMRDSDTPIDAFEVISTRAMMRAFLNSMEEFNFDFLIGKKDKLLYALNLDKELDGADLSLEMEFSEFNEPIEIKAPDNYLKLEDVIEIPEEWLNIPDQEQEDLTDSRIKSDNQFNNPSLFQAALRNILLGF